MPISPGIPNPNQTSSPTNNPAPGAPQTVPTSGNLVSVPPSQQTHIGNAAPPPMQTLVYSPDVRILIAHNGTQYDVSADLIRGTVIRKENSASSLLFSCHNKGLRYTGVNGAHPLVGRMDRVTCYMKRAGTWVQVFSGYLDSIPYVQLYPGVVQFKATCTLKRLLCNWWNPGLPESQNILNQLDPTNQGVGGDGQQAGSDTGMGSMLRRVLNQVGGWDMSTIHIQNFPSGFMDLLQAQMKEQQNNQFQADKFRQMLEGDVSTPAPGAMAGYNTAAGAPGVYGSGAQFYIGEIVRAADASGCGPSVTDLNVSSGVQKAAQKGEQSQDSATQAAFQELQKTAQYSTASAKTQDGAILGVACAMLESGGGTLNLKMYANNQDPDSLNYAHDAISTDHDSEGLFQQRMQGWGTTAQRMNAYASAMMFFQALNKEQWRNMDPGTAVYQVQRAADPVGYAAKINSYIPQATQAVQQIRGSTGTGSVSPTGGPSGGLQSPSVLAAGNGSPGTNPLSPGTATTPPTNTPVVPADSRVGKPSPDSEGAINWELTQLGKPYKYGADGPDMFDCSSLQEWGFRSINLNIGRNTTAQAGNGQRIVQSNAARGDTMQPHDQHTTMWMGDGTIIEAADEGIPIHHVPNNYKQLYGFFRFCGNGGVDPAAPFNHNMATAGPGNPPMTGGSSDGGGGASSGGGATGGGAGEGIAQNLFSYIFDPGKFITPAAMMYGLATPQKDYIDSQPLMQMVQSICGACLRNFASAPNGDFIAYYPDFFGMDGKPAVFILEDIELKDLTMNFSDDALATHVYVNGDWSMQGLADQEMGWLLSMGYATVENQQLYQRMRMVAPGDLENMDGQSLMRRFGVRPVQKEYSTVWAKELEFLLAVRIFLEKWAAQYQSSCSMTFLPDLFPGMRVQLAGHNLQFYVNEVTHTFDFEQGFTTQAVLMAPSNPNLRNLWGQQNNNTNTQNGQTTPPVSTGGQVTTPNPPVTAAPPKVIST